MDFTWESGVKNTGIDWLSEFNIYNIAVGKHHRLAKSMGSLHICLVEKLTNDDNSMII